MIRVLQSWEEVGGAYRHLVRLELPTHHIAPKNWDLALVAHRAERLPSDALIVDLGCAGEFALELLAALGFTRLVGVDLQVSTRTRLRLLLRSLRTRTRPYVLHKADLTATSLPDLSVDLLLCLSVIEHGVNFDGLMREAARVLRPGGVLLITTDYWPEPPSTTARPFGLDWRVLGPEDLVALVAAARRAGLSTDAVGEIPSANDAVVHWLGLDYTFAAVTFEQRT